MKKFYTLIGFITVLSITVTAQIINVPEDQPTIQEGIDVASDSDTVLVANGTYVENINFLGKTITVASQFLMDGDTNHISNTIIDGSEAVDPDFGSVVTFNSGEDTTSVLYGFTITGGTGTSILEGPTDAKAGGGIFISRSGGKLLYNYIEYNEVVYDKLTMGGGLTAGGPMEDPQPWVVLRGNRISHNISNSSAFQASGGGLEIYYNLIMEGNEVSYNTAQCPILSVAGGASIRGGFAHIEIYVKNNLITQNKSVSNNIMTDYSEGGGLLMIRDCSGTVSNNIITFNEVNAPEEITCFGAGVMMGMIGPELVFENNFITNNFFTGGGYGIGGGVCFWHSGGTYQNNVIQNNNGTWGGGIAVAYNNSDSLSVLVNNTITGNEGVYGGGTYFLEADAVIINTILWNNEASEEGAEIFELESNVEVRHSDIEGGWPGNGNMDVDPIFRPDGYHLDVWSTLVNEGTSSILIDGEWYDCPEYDIDGQERPFSFEAEIGADEAMWNYVAIEEQLEELGLQIFPNPASTSVTISFENYNFSQGQSAQLDIYTTLGKIVFSNAVNAPEYSFDVNHLPAGIYFIKLRIDNLEIMEKLLVNK